MGFKNSRLNPLRTTTHGGAGQFLDAHPDKGDGASKKDYQKANKDAATVREIRGCSKCKKLPSGGFCGKHGKDAARLGLYR